MTLVVDFRMHNASGIGRYITNILPLLLDKFEITLLCNSNDSLDRYDWTQCLAKIYINAKIYSIKEQIELFLKIPKCDFFWSPHYNIPILPIKAKKRVVTIHDVCHLAFAHTLSFIQKIYANLILNFATKLSDIILTDSEFSKQEIIKYTKTNKSINVVYCGVQKLGKASQELYDFDYILYVGNIKPHKNITMALEAYKKIKPNNPDLKFVIVGKKEKFINADIESINSNIDGVIFTGEISDEDLISLYVSAKLLVFISLYEGFGLPPIEAQLYNCPVLASNVSSIPEVCGNGALYCNPYDINSVTQQLAILLTDKGLKKQLVENGQLNIKRFDWNNTALQISNILYKYGK